MTRKSIFEIMQENRDFLTEATRLHDLFTEPNGVVIKYKKYGTDRTSEYSVFNFVNKYVYRHWRNRGTSIDCYDLCEQIGLSDLDEFEELETEEFLRYLEFSSNIIDLLKYVELEPGFTFEETGTQKAIKKNIKTCLDWMNFEIKSFPKKQMVLVVEKNASATAAAETVEEDLSYKIINYNHFLLKGDIDRKKAILKSMGDSLEPKRSILERINKGLASDIFMMLNNMNIRHNNVDKDDKANYNEYVDNMKKKELEHWYDELYQMILLALLEMDNIDRNKSVSELKKKMFNA